MDFFNNKKVLITGHTGFKGSWLCKILINLGANITGYSLQPQAQPSLYELSGINKEVHSIIGDIRDFNKLKKTFDDVKPDIVFHLAAQPIVRESYINPLYTYETNVMGTVNLLECVRIALTQPKSVVNITTDKVYKNNEWEWGYREYEPLDGFDPYSNSKSCSELVTHSYKNSFFASANVAVSTARAGNVIGGGDFAADRIIPDCVRAAEKKEPIIVRNPNSIRPYQHVLEPLYAYMMIAQKQYQDINYSGHYNVGPDESDCITTKELVELFCNKWGNGQQYEIKSTGGPHEASFLKLDCSKLKNTFNWKPHWNIEEAVERTVDWTKAYVNGENITKVMDTQIFEFFNYHIN